MQTAAGQGALLFVAAGALGLLSLTTPSAGRTPGNVAVYASSLAFGVLVALLPWDRWNPRATLAIVPPALVLIVAGQWSHPEGTLALYGVWFIVLYVWIGSWHPARTSVIMGPLAAACYVAPFLPTSPAASPDALSTVIVAIPIAIVLGEVLAAKAAAMQSAQSSLETAAVLLRRANLTDDLTGVGNRRQANAILDGMQPGDGLVLIDLDHFKVINDTYGHAEGDRVLMQVGAYLRTAVRDADLVARFGGEEFLVVVRGAGSGLAGAVERILAGWRALDPAVTLSAGAVLHAALRDPTATFKLADELMYKAKTDGRDRMAISVGW